MKQKNLILGLILAMSIATPALAKEMGVEVKGEAEIRGPKTGISQKLQNVFEFRKEDKDERSGSSTGTTTGKVKIEKVHDDRGGFLGNIAGMRVKNIGKLFEALINRFEKLIDRIESRENKIEDAGGNTTEAEASITLAKTNLTEAKADLSAFLALDFGKGTSTKATSTATTTAELNFEKAKTLATEIRDDLRKVKESLKKAVSSLVSIQKTIKVNVNASSSATSTNN